MPSRTIPLRIYVNFTDQGEPPALHAYVFTAGGKLIGHSPLDQNVATVDVPAALDGHLAQVILGPGPAEGQPDLTATALKRLGSYSARARILSDGANVEIALSGTFFPHWCFCYVHGRLVKRFTLPDGTSVERPVCNARVTICDVDYIPLVIAKLPEREIFRLRDDLLARLPGIPVPPPPEPDPGPTAVMMHGGLQMSDRAPARVANVTTPAAFNKNALAGIATSTSVGHVRQGLNDLADMIVFHICDLVYLWPFFSVECLTTLYADSDGRFGSFLVVECDERPSLYFSVEQFRDGAWHSVYTPSIGCGTYWNFVCGTEVVLNLPGADACEDPTYDPPPGVTLFVLPYAIGNTPIWGTPPAEPAFPGGPAVPPPAPDGWVRADGRVNYASEDLGLLHDAPFGRTLNFIQDDSYFIPSTGIKYYRYSYRRLTPGQAPNTGAADTTWTPIATALSHGYRIEYSDRLPTYEGYPVGPNTIGSNSGLFEFKPQQPPARPTDAPTVVVREWTSGDLNEVAASWDTMTPAPPLSATITVDQAGDFEVKIEVFDAAGDQVMPGAGTFQFIMRNLDGITTRLATGAEEAGGAYVLGVHVDNNGTSADLPQPSIGGVAASDDCGFLRYSPAIWCGSGILPPTPTTRPCSASPSHGDPTTRRRRRRSLRTSKLRPWSHQRPRRRTPRWAATTGAISRIRARRDVVNAAFAANLGVYGKATDGYERLALDAGHLIAFALAEQAL